jgi:ClpP class serine protease
MSIYFPLVAQQMFNTPLAMHESMAEMVISALSGRMNISELVTSAGVMDRSDLMARSGSDKKSKPMANVTPSSTYGDDFYSVVGGVAIIPVYGALTKSGGLCSTGYNDFQSAHMAAMNDDAVKAVWYDINSGGGTIAGLFGLTDIIHSTNEKNGGKPVWAFAGDTAFSAAYAIGAAADKFYMPDLGGVGSVGCIAMVADASKALEKDGVSVKVIRSTPGKALLSGIEPIDGDPAMEGALAKLQGQVKMAGDYFVEKVASYRGISKKAVADSDGSDYMGAEAKVIGFVSDVMSEAAAFAKLTRKIA